MSVLQRVFLVVGCLLLALTVAVGAQDKKPEDKKPDDKKADKEGKKEDKKDEREDIGHQKFERPKDYSFYLQNIRTGEQPPTSERARKIIQEGSRYIILNFLTDPDVLGGRGKEGVNEALANIGRAFPPFPKDPTQLRDMPKQELQNKLLLLGELRQAMLPHVERLRKSNDLAMRLAAVRVLHVFAQEAHDEIAEALVKVIADPAEHDAVRLWCFKAVADLNTTPPRDPKAAQDPNRAKRLEQLALAVYAWLDRRCSIKKDDLDKLASAEWDGLRYVRREAIRAMASYGRPIIVDPDKREREKGAKQEGPAALLLVRIMAADKDKEDVLPTPGWAERAEAAHALTIMKHKLSPSYKPEYAAHQVGRFIADMAAEARNSREDERWKYFAWLLMTGWDALGKDIAGTEAATQIKDLTRRVNSTLELVFDPDKGDPAAPQELGRWLTSNQPKAAALFDPPFAGP